MNIRTFTRTTAAFVALCGFTTLPSAAQNVQFSWARNIGSGSLEYSYAVAKDGTGNVYVSGYFSGTGDFDPGPGSATLTAAGQDVFLLKLNASGNFVWVKQMGGPGNDQAYALALDPAGNIYTAGYFSNTADFDPGTGTAGLTAVNSADVFISKLDASGNYVWAKQLGGPGWDQPSALRLDAAGNIYTTGYFQSTADFDPGTASAPLTTSGSFDIFVSKLDAAGNYVWARKMGGNGSDFSMGLALDAAGNVHTTGFFQNAADFDPGTAVVNLSSAGGYDVFVSKLDASGNYVWAKQLSGIGNDQANGIGVDAAGNVYTTGNFEGLADFDPGTGTHFLTSNGNADIFLSKLDASGNFVWVQQMGGTDNEYGNALSLDAVGNPCILGYYNSTVDFDPGTAISNLVSAGADDIFAAKYKGSGDFLWAKGLGGFSNDYGFALATDSAGHVYTAGMFNGTGDFDPGTGSSILDANNGHAFVQKMVCVDTTTTTLTQTACDSFRLNGITYTASGTYVQRRPNTLGCDSIIRLYLTIPVLNAAISYSGGKLHTNGPYTTYQWLLNDAPISGATDSTYTVTQNGSYRVVVTNADGCRDTSAIQTVTNVSAVQQPGLANQVVVYPNPAFDRVSIQSPVAVTAELVSMDGKMLRTGDDKGGLSLEGLVQGLYLIRIRDSRTGLLLRNEKLLKER